MEEKSNFTEERGKVLLELAVKMAVSNADILRSVPKMSLGEHIVTIVRSLMVNVAAYAKLTSHSEKEIIGMFITTLQREYDDQAD